MFKSRIEVTANNGRTLITTDVVQKSDVIVEETAFAIGPISNSGIVCLGCYSYLPVEVIDNEASGSTAEVFDRCGRCTWPLCKDCADGQDHKAECQIFVASQAKFTGILTEYGICQQLNCITPLRYLINGPFCKKSQDILIEEIPFALGPKCGSSVVCLECYKPIVDCEDEDGDDWCMYCGWPLCSDCQLRDAKRYHQPNECKVFAAANAKFYKSQINGAIHCPQLDCITPLRVLLGKESNPERWSKEVEPMEYHDEERRQYEKIWHADLVNVAQYLRGPCKLADRFSEELIMQVVGILEVNAFEARTSEGYPLRCLYPTTGILAHNCVPNTIASIYPSENYTIRLRAMIDLEPGQQLHHCYTYTLDGTNQRQEHLKAGKYFNCICNRCKDPTELATNLSTFKCSKCDDGWLLWDNPLDTNTIWKCTKCELKRSNNTIRTAVAVMQGEVENLQNMDWSAERLQETERLLSKYDCVIHPQHFIQTSLRLNLVHMYGHVQGYEINELPIELLERKEELCRQLLNVLKILEPGISRTRAMLLYELYSPIVLIAKNAYISGTLTGNGLKEKVFEAIEILKECADILKFEDDQTQEGILGFMAKQAMHKLTNSINDIPNEDNSTTL